VARGVRASLLKKVKDAGFRTEKDESGVDLIYSEDGRLLGGLDSAADEQTGKNLFAHIEKATGRAVE
jgi:hypothetical protein